MWIKLDRIMFKLTSNGHLKECKRSLLSSIFLLLTFSTQAQFSQLDPTSDSVVNQTVNQFMSEHQIVGATVCLIDSGKIVLLKGYGYQDLDNQIPATEYTMYRTGSIAKAFTAVVALQLWEDSLLNILDDVEEYVPEWPIKPEGIITPYRLLAHRSGINHYQDFDTLLMINYEPTYHDFDAIAALDIFKDADLIFPPGSQFGYSTFGYNLLGAVTERAENKPFENQVRERINSPFHLPYLQPEYAWKRPYPQETKGYHFEDQTLVETGDDIGILYKVPGGGFICTAIDLALFSIAMMENQLYQDTTLFQWAANPAHSGSVFGLGIMNAYASKHYLWHGGGQQRTHSLFMFYPDDKSGVIICSNTFIQGFPIQHLGEILIDTIPYLTVVGEDWVPIPDTIVAPELISPAQSDTVLANGDSLIWSKVDHAFSYIYEYSTDSNFTSSITDTIYENHIFINSFQLGKTYYWKVCGLNTYLYDTIIGNWSKVGIFNTEITSDLADISLNKIKIFPNPTNGLVTIQGPFGGIDVKVFNHLGQAIKVDFASNKIDLSAQPKGIYYIKIIPITGSAIVKKLIIN